MGHKEKSIINNILSDLPENERLFRANSGTGWVGDPVRKGDFLILKNPRPFHGMPEGFPDLVGFRSVIVTPDMVGKKIAVFRCIEVKAGKTRTTKLQILFRELVIRMGGIFEIVRG